MNVTIVNSGLTVRCIIQDINTRIPVVGDYLRYHVNAVEHKAYENHSVEDGLVEKVIIDYVKSNAIVHVNTD